MQNVIIRSHWEILAPSFFSIDSFSAKFSRCVNVDFLGFSQKQLELVLRPLTYYRNFTVVYVKVTESSGNVARDCYQRNGPAVVVAGRQTAGRGRYGRRWISEHEGNVYMSIALHCPGDGNFFSELSQCLAQRIAADFFLKFSIALTVKRPNDLLFAGAKVGGILLERIIPAGLVVGIGLNLLPDDDLQSQCAQPVGCIIPQLSIVEVLPVLCSAVAREMTQAITNPTEPTERS
jgi:biotin-[acetyl-CoA-carboxylase] ligase BirA-like protein